MERKHISHVKAYGKDETALTWEACECKNKMEHTHLLDYMFGALSNNHRCPCELEATVPGDGGWTYGGWTFGQSWKKPVVDLQAKQLKSNNNYMDAIKAKLAELTDLINAVEASPAPVVHPEDTEVDIVRSDGSVQKFVIPTE